ncbi:glycerol-3-phosphate acyltransferase [Sporosarcina sp.]|uniref:glycerol-3-phosphate acyltransferase n=1 Tax=Sporosarcina sp. TaxID=49982 RepID=UPI0026066602|nr:glycerol-3-phosphate acyltransferase [Sporosarcina sp.]
MTLLLFILCYLVGGVLPALYVGRAKGIDIRSQGSGNPGARNAGRMLGEKAFVLVLVLDAAKGALPVLVGKSLGFSPAVVLLLLFAVMLGHCFPILHHFRGGKGAASLLGGIIAFQPLLAVPIILAAVVLYAFIREKTKVSVLAMTVIIPMIAILHGWLAGGIALCLIALLLVTHRSYLL